MNTNEVFFLVVGVLIGLGVAYFFLWGQPYSELNGRYNKLVQDYQQLNIKYNQLNEECTKIKSDCEAFKADTKQLLVTYVAQETLWEISGMEKYRRLIEVLGILIKH